MLILDWLQRYSGTIQSITQLVGALVGLITLPVLIMTLRTVSKAAKAASDLAEAARTFTEVSWAQQLAAERAATAAEAQVQSALASGDMARLQLTAAQESAAAEREHSKLIRQQLQASLTPILSFSHRMHTDFYSIVLENQSNAVAFDISAFNGTPENPGAPLELSHTLLAGRAEIGVRGINRGREERAADGRLNREDPAPIFARYRSQDGRWFRTKLANFNDANSCEFIEEEPGE